MQSSLCQMHLPVRSWEIPVKACFLERNEEEIVVDCRNLEPPAVSWT